ncbi:MAG: DUF418 domain-containing protein [Phycisphaerales bacterium]|nr:DUF418 domain-containing protein [Phycisphaerales bacterium]
MAPTKETERISAIDALRGFALFGILLVNVTFFANGAPTALENAWSTGNTLDDIALFISRFFGNYKFVTLFSVLFGMGLALQSDRADRRDVSFTAVYSRRLLILLGFGIIHGIVLWYGDILSMYAILGFIAMLFRHTSRRTLLRTATVLAFIPILLMPGLFALEHMTNSYAPSESDNQTKTAPIPNDEVELTAQDASAAIEPDVPINIERIMQNFGSVEVELYRRGPFHLSIIHRGITYLVLSIFVGVTILGWRCLAMFLLGIAVIRSGVMTKLSEHRRSLIRLVTIAMPIGVAIQACGEFVGRKYRYGYWETLIPELATYIGSFGLTAGYFGLICLLSLGPLGRRGLAPFAAAGRMALTNYIGQSVLCGLIFYSYGMGLIGRLRFSMVLLIVCCVFAFQVVVSAIWLRHFLFGPLEWLWRSLTYARRQPMRRRLVAPLTASSAVR